MKKYLITIAALSLVGAGCIKHPYETGQGIPRQDYPFVSATATMDTSTWQTFSDNAAGITFKYPSTWPTPKFKEVMIYFGPMASIDLIDQTWFNNNYGGCLKKEEEGVCKKNLGRTPDELDKMIKFVSGVDTNPTNYNVGCDAIGGDPIVKNSLRTVYFCGYDVSIDNYVYYAPSMINGKLVELRLPLFPPNTPINAWATEASGGAMTSNFEAFSKNLETSLKNGQLNELLAKQMTEYNAIADSIKKL